MHLAALPRRCKGPTDQAWLFCRTGQRHHRSGGSLPRANRLVTDRGFDAVAHCGIAATTMAAPAAPGLPAPFQGHGPEFPFCRASDLSAKDHAGCIDQTGHQADVWAGHADKIQLPRLVGRTTALDVMGKVGNRKSPLWLCPEHPPEPIVRRQCKPSGAILRHRACSRHGCRDASFSAGKTPVTTEARHMGPCFQSDGARTNLSRRSPGVFVVPVPTDESTTVWAGSPALRRSGERARHFR